MTYLTDEAWELVHKAPHVINKLAERINATINDVAEGKETEEDFEIAHVGYDEQQCGREK